MSNITDAINKSLKANNMPPYNECSKLHSKHSIEHQFCIHFISTCLYHNYNLTGTQLKEYDRDI